MKKLTKPIQVYASKKGEIEKLIKGLTKNSSEFRRIMGKELKQDRGDDSGKYEQEKGVND